MKNQNLLPLSSLCKSIRLFSFTLFLLVLAVKSNAQSFRYLQFHIIECSNLQIYEIEFYAKGQMLPARMTSAHEGGVNLSSTYHADWEVVKPFDGDVNTQAYTPACDGILTHTIYIDFGIASGYEFDSVMINKRGWNALNHFKILGSEDNMEWDQLLDTIPSEPYWSGWKSFPLEAFIDSLAPTRPGNFAAGFIKSNSVSLNWGASVDNIGVTGYEVFQNGTVIDTVTNTFLTISGLNPGSAYSYYLNAFDQEGNASPNTDTLVIITSETDSESPSDPTGLNIDNAGEDIVYFSWTASTDNAGVTGYIIYLDNVPVGVTDQTQYAIPGLKPETSYSIMVKAKDAEGNFSSSGTSANFTTAAADPDAKMKMSTNFNGMWDTNHSDPFLPDHNHVLDENPWNPDMMNDLTVYYTLRFMQYEETNGGYVEDNWNTRNQKSSNIQQPMAHEWKIDLCNRLKKNPWICINHNLVDRNGIEGGSNNYLKKLAILLKTGVDMKDVDLDRPEFSELSTMTRYDFVAAGGIPVCEPLDPSLKIYIEYSNETWNSAVHYQPQLQHCYYEGNALGLGGSDDWGNQRRFHSWACLRIWEEMEEVLGKDTPRLTRVDAYFIAIPSNINDHFAVYDNASQNPNGIYPDVISPGPYFGHSVDGSSASAAADLKASIATPVSNSKTYRSMIDQKAEKWDHELKLVGYEAGQHVTNNSDQINNDPAIYEIYLEYLDSMSHYYDELAHFVHSGVSVEGQAFGAKIGWDQDIADAHKWRAILDWLDASPSILDTELPAVPGNLQEVTVTTNSISFSWDESTDNEEISGYHVYINGILLGSTVDNMYTINGLNPGTDYILTVAAKDAAGNLSAQSDVLQLTTMSVETYSLTLSVSDGVNPLPGAVVNLNEGIRITNESGQVFFTEVKGSGLHCTVSLEGYNTQTVSIDVIDGDVSESVTLVLTSYYDVSFNVTDGTEPLEGAEIEMNETILNTDSEGTATYTGIVEQSEISWTASLEGYELASGSFILEKDTVVEVIMVEVSHDGLENSKHSKIKMFPNPATDYLNITGLDTDAGIMIVDLNGKTLIREKVQGNRVEVNLKNLARGIYIVKVAERNNIHYLRLIVR